MSPAGVYRSQNFSLPTAVCVNAGDLIFTATHFDEDHQPNEFNTDFYDLLVEEIPLAMGQ
jgi:hypothetical protein